MATITRKLPILKSSSAERKDREAALGVLMERTWTIVVNQAPSWLSDQDKADAANEGFFSLFKNAPKLPELENHEHFYKIMAHYTQSRGIDILRKNVRYYAPLEGAEELSRIARNDEDLETSDLFQHVLEFFASLEKDQKLLGRLAYLKFLQPDKERKQLLEEMDIPDALFGRLVTRLNKRVDQFCKQCLSE
jgi:hypothetical protein